MASSNLASRLRLLEAWNDPAHCLDCEMDRLNRAVAGEPERVGFCTHRPGLTLRDALVGLYERREAQHGNA